MRYVLFDIDGCIADDRWREDMRRAGRWGDYHLAAIRDNAMNKEVVYLYQLDPHVRIVFITGRPARFKDSTEEWLRRHDFITGSQSSWLLLMRPDDDKSSPNHVHKINQLKASGIEADDVIGAFDDMERVLKAYREYGIKGTNLLDHDGRRHYVSPKEDTKPRDAADILREMAETYQRRNAAYRNNYKSVPRVMSALFPDGVPPRLVEYEHFHLFELMVVKLTRFANSNMGHVESIHDAAVYAAMIEAILSEEDA